MIKLENTVAYTAEEAAVMLNRAISTVRTYIRSGKLRAHKVGRTYYITEKTLTEFITGERPQRKEERKK